MARFVLRYRGVGAKPADVLAEVLKLVPSARIVDESSRMVLVDPSIRNQYSEAKLPDWTISPELMCSLPQPPVQKVPVG
jgi:hypothetical protein